jgi:hypothetical protein
MNNGESKAITFRVVVLDSVVINPEIKPREMPNQIYNIGSGEM